jgi:hypothetical protein
MTNEVRELFEFVVSNGRSILNDYSGSRAASTQQEPKDDVRITEMIDGVIVSKPARKFTDFNQRKQQEQSKQESESEPVIIDLGNSKAGSSVSGSRHGTNPVKELFDFIRRNRY